MLNSESIVIIRIKGDIYYIAKYPGGWSAMDGGMFTI